MRRETFLCPLSMTAAFSSALLGAAVTMTDAGHLSAARTPANWGWD